MNTSEKATKILASILNIQDRMIVEPDGENKHLKAKYATLDNILKTVKPILKEEGLIILQDTQSEDRSITCTTRICHAESGEWFESSSTVPIEKTSAQGVGSSTTYGRRYSLCTALGIGMNNDDDGNAAETALTKAEEKKVAQDDLQKFKGAIFPRMNKFDAEPLQLAFEESGYISESEDKEEMIRELIGQVNSKEKLTTIGKRAKALQDEIEESLKETNEGKGVK